MHFFGFGPSSSSSTAYFFRYHAPNKVIVSAWVNDEDSKRAFERSATPVGVFRKMLKAGIRLMTGIGSTATAVLIKRASLGPVLGNVV